jgi:hypothetical protein
MSGMLAAAWTPNDGLIATLNVINGVRMRVRSRNGLSASDEPSYAWSRSSATNHAPSLNRPPATPSVDTPTNLGRFGFAQPLHVIWADAAVGNNVATPNAIAQISPLNMFPRGWFSLNA